MPDFDPTQYVEQSSYGMHQGAVFFHSTMLVSLIDENVEDTLAAVHRNTVRNLMSRYYENRKLARTFHRQLLAIVRGYIPQWENDKRSFVKDAKAAVEQAEKLEEYAAGLMEKERARRQQGNVFVIKAKPAEKTA